MKKIFFFVCSCIAAAIMFIRLFTGYIDPTKIFR